MSERGRHAKPSLPAASPGQAHLPAPPPVQQMTAADESARIDKLVSFTFDSDPAVRRQAAIELARLDDPRAVFALLELTSDKDEGVQALARSSLEQFAGKEERETIINLEKIFESRQELKSPEDVEATKRKMMPSIEKLFSRHKGARERLMPSIEKLFSWMQPKGAPGGAMLSPLPTSATSPAYQSERQAAAKASSEMPDSLPSVDAVSPKSRFLEEAEADVGVPPERRNPDLLRKTRPILEQDGSISTPSLPPPAYSRHAAPSETELEKAADFPLPEYLRQRPVSPTAAIPTMMPEEQTPAELAEEADKRLPRSRLDFYKWAYALAVTPGIKTAELKKEKDRLIKEAKSDIELAFHLAAERAKENGIESLGGLKPGMKKIASFPLQVIEVSTAQVPHGRGKTMPMARLGLSDGKRVVPLYVSPERSDGIKVGDLISLRDALVDYFVHSQELVLLLGKNGQMVVTK